VSGGGELMTAEQAHERNRRVFDEAAAHPAKLPAKGEKG
jgi:hypothetical protein